MPFSLPTALKHYLALLTLILLLAGCHESPRYEPLPAGTTVLAFGDSVTHGTGADADEDYPALLARATGWRVINAGIPGDTAQRALSRLEPLLQQHKPELVIIGLGGNDFLRRRPASDVKEELRSMVHVVQQSGASVALLAVPELSVFRGGIGMLSDSAIYEELAEEEGIILIAGVFSRVLSDDSLKADAIHPNARGYREMNDGILKALAQVGLTATLAE